MRQQFSEPLNALTCIVEHFTLSSTQMPPFANVQMLLALPRHAFFVDCVWNMMAHALKPRFRLSAKRTSPFKSFGGGGSVQSTTGSRCARISGSIVGYTMFRGSVKSTGYPIHSPVSPSLPLPSVTLCHHISTGLYLTKNCTIDITAHWSLHFAWFQELSKWIIILTHRFENKIYVHLTQHPIVFLQNPL